MAQYLIKNKRVIRCILAIFAVFAVSFLCTQNTFADCNSYGGTCDCGASSCGAAWINNNSGGDGNNGLWTQATVSGGDQIVTAYIHGAIQTWGEWKGDRWIGPSGMNEPSTAYHTFLVSEPWPGGQGSDGNYGEWEWDDSGINTKQWAHDKKEWWYSSYDDDEGGEIYRGVVAGYEGGWSKGWENGSMQIQINLNALLLSGVEQIGEDDEGTLFSKRTHIFRCYYSYKGCNTDETTILIYVKNVPDITIDKGWRVNYQGRISFKNDDNSPLYRSGSKVSSNNWTDVSGWQPGYTLTNLYTPKESGQKLRSTYHLRWKCNNWEGDTVDGDYCGWKRHYLQYFGTNYPYASKEGYKLRSGWWTQYDFSSDIGLNNRKTTGGGNFSNVQYNHGWNNTFEITVPQRTRTIDPIPYGFAKHYEERLNYVSSGNRSADVAEIVVWGTCCSGSGENRTCWTCVKRNYILVDAHNENNSKDAHNSIDVNVFNPYNFTTSLSSGITGGNGSTVLGGGTVSLLFSTNIKSRTDTTAYEQVGFPYFTKVPDNTEGNVPTVVTAASFILKPDTDASSLSIQLKDRTDVLKNAVPNNDLCAYLRNTFGNNLVADGRNDCHTLFTEDHNSINNNIGDTGWDTSKNNTVSQNGVSAITSEHQNISVSIPDLEDGYKYCTVIGINHADSGGRDGGYRYISNHDDTFKLPSYSINDNWHLSNVSCRTIAKVPTFQVWGNIYTSGGIEAVTAKKIPDADIKTDSNSQKYLFGSWSETFSLANKNIKNFGTGASLGYLSDGRGGLPINDNVKSQNDSNWYTSSSNNKVSYCNITNMTIANNRCNSNIAGNAGNIVVSNEDFLNKFVAHYATTSEGSLDQVSDTTRYYKAKGNVTFNDTGALADNGYRLSNGVISINKNTPTNNRTLIYYVDGNVTINHNVCTGYPTINDQCNNGTNDPYVYHFYNLDNANNSYSATFDKIPQVIIIASGDVNIDRSVTEIDAWVYSGGTIRTCYNGTMGDKYSCNNPLIVHGPVFAKNIELHRTYGSNSGRTWGGAFNNMSGIFYSGAATPAEIFNLRPDVYEWIYQQTSTDNKHANIRYMREVSPRY